jgi:hypothetical protein
MFKKFALLAIIATAVFATPVSSRFDDPLPMCDPCTNPNGPPPTPVVSFSSVQVD